MTALSFPGVGMMKTTASPVLGTNTVALLHMNGSNGGTTFTDETFRQSWTVGGGETTSTVQKKFGTASLLIGSGLGITPSSAINCGTGDFTLECFFYPTNVNFDILWRTFPGEVSSLDSYCFWNKVDGRFEYYSDAGANYVYGTSSAPSLNTWHHIAFVKSSGVGTWYLDGVALGAARQGTITTPNKIISLGGGSFYYLDEFRASNTARYTSGFTPTASEFTVD